MSNLHHHFFEVETPQMLQKLQPEAQPIWGAMNALQMVDHLRVGFVLMRTMKACDLLIPEERLEDSRAHLMSDRNFMKSVPKPQIYTSLEKVDYLDLQAAKDAFLEELQVFNTHTQTTPAFFSAHPYYGKLNAAQTRQLNYKHIKHHFSQFQLL